MLNLSEFLSWGYWFNSQVTEFHYVIPVTTIFMLLIIAAFVVKKLIKINLKNKLSKKFLKDVPTALYIFGFTGLIFTFLRYEHVKYLSVRFWFLILLVAFIAWIAFHIFQFKVLYPQVECEYKSMQNVDKYRPSPKHKKGKKNKR